MIATTTINSSKLRPLRAIVHSFGRSGIDRLGGGYTGPPHGVFTCGGPVNEHHFVVVIVPPSAFTKQWLSVAVVERGGETHAGFDRVFGQVRQTVNVTRPVVPGDGTVRLLHEAAAGAVRVRRVDPEFHGIEAPTRRHGDRPRPADVVISGVGRSDGKRDRGSRGRGNLSGFADARGDQTQQTSEGDRERERPKHAAPVDWFPAQSEPGVASLLCPPSVRVGLCKLA